jgi:hypothetical protein
MAKFTVGCYIDGNQMTPDEFNREIISFAETKGYVASCDDDPQEIYEESESAISWLNANTERPAYTYWMVDDSILFLLPSATGEDEDVLEVTDLPSYILHTNDHGNQTLYSVTYHEEWGVV